MSFKSSSPAVPLSPALAVARRSPVPALAQSPPRQVHPALAGRGQLRSTSDRRKVEGDLRQARHRHRHQPRLRFARRRPGDRHPASSSSAPCLHHRRSSCSPPRACRSSRIATLDYDAGMGVGVLGDSPITSSGHARRQESRRRPHLRRIPVLPRLRPRNPALTSRPSNSSTPTTRCWSGSSSEKQVDAMTGIASSSLPIFISKKIPVRWMLYSTAMGLPVLWHVAGRHAGDPAAEGPRRSAPPWSTPPAKAMAFALNNPDEATALVRQGPARNGA